MSFKDPVSFCLGLYMVAGTSDPGYEFSRDYPNFSLSKSNEKSSFE